MRASGLCPFPTVPTTASYLPSVLNFGVGIKHDNTLIDFDCTTRALKCHLPGMGVVDRGFVVGLRKADSGVNAVTIVPAGGDTINGQTSYILASQYETLWLVSTGSGWDIITAGIPQFGQSRSSCTTALTATTNVTLANITGMSHNVAAGLRYAFRVRLFTTSTVNGGLKLGFGGTATATSIIANTKTFNAATLNTPNQVTSLGALYGATVVTDFVEIDGTIVVNAGGTITLQAAQNVSHADTTTIKVGSVMHFERLP